MMETAPKDGSGGRDDLVELDREHPGFRDAAYRERRNAIARIAHEYREGDPVPEVEYTDEEQGVWSTVWDSLDPLHERYACRQYVGCAERLSLSRERIPQLHELNPRLVQETGFQMFPVAGLVSPRVFLTYLGRDVFLSTQYIRHHSEPLYTPEPDIVHELIGHAPSFLDEWITRLSRAFGTAAPVADEERILHLIRLYWWTLEFGAVEEDGALKVYGAGLLSSFGELGRFEKQAKLLPLEIGTVVETPFDPTNYQNTIFVASSWDHMCETVFGFASEG